MSVIASIHKKYSSSLISISNSSEQETLERKEKAKRENKR